MDKATQQSGHRAEERNPAKLKGQRAKSQIQKKGKKGEKSTASGKGGQKRIKEKCTSTGTWIILAEQEGRLQSQNKESPRH